MNRSALATIFSRLGLPRLVLSLRRQRGLGSIWLTVLTYHRVAPAEDAYVFDDGVLDATPESFERQVAFLKRWFRIIGLDELTAFRRGAPLPPNPLLLTFDDGY